LLEASPLPRALILDEKVHHEWAAQFAAGQPWSVERATGEPIPYFRAPLYIWWLGTLYRVFGADSGLAPRLVQAVLGSLACGFTFLLGRRLLGAPAAWIAGLAMALHWALVFYDGELLITSPIVLLDVLLLLALVRAAEDRRARWWALSGLLLGLSAIARPDVLVFAPAAFLWLVWLERPLGRRALAAAAALGLGTLAPILPVTARNWFVGHDRVLISSQGGVNFYIGNNPHSDGTTAVVPGTPVGWWEGYDRTHADAARALGRKPLESEVSQHYFALGREFWRTQPWKALELTAWKLRCLLNRQEWANNKCLYTVVDEFTPTTGWLPIGFWIVGPLGLFGLALAFRDARRLFPLWGFVVIYAAGITAFFVTARFRLPLLPALILLAAHAVVWLLERARRRELVPLAGAGLALAALFTFVNWIPGRGPFQPAQRQTADFLGTFGNELANRGQNEAALRWLHRAAEAASAELASGEALGRRAEYLRIVHFSTIYRAGLVLEAEGRHQEAIGAFRQIVPLVPPVNRPDLHERMARCFEALGQADRAAEQRAKAARARHELSAPGSTQGPPAAREGPAPGALRAP
jgi:4-amino-4-deoxy-L-arabinose transferase-like glycosyltransferase